MPGAHNIGAAAQPFPAQNYGRKNYGHEAFSEFLRKKYTVSGGRAVPTKRLFKENAPFHSFVLMGLFARTLFSQTLLH